MSMPKSDLWILIASGEGAAALVVSDIRAGLHRLSCCCKAETPEECGDEMILGVLRDMEDEDQWARDEAGNPFSFTWQHECGCVEIVRLARQDVAQCANVPELLEPAIDSICLRSSEEICSAFQVSTPRGMNYANSARATIAIIIKQQIRGCAQIVRVA